MLMHQETGQVLMLMFAELLLLQYLEIQVKLNLPH